MTKTSEEVVPEQEEIVAETSTESSESAAKPEPDYQELYQRLLADQENQRKRFEQEKKQLAQFAIAGAVQNLLPIVDNFYRATEHVPAEQKDSPWLMGIMHIQKQFQDTLEGWGVVEIPCKPGDVLDPNIHEAIGTVENSEIPEDHIVTIQNRGYTLNGKLIRPVTVITSKSK